MNSASLYKFGSGGGGLIGDDHIVLLRRCIIKEHSFESKDRDTGVVTQTYEPGCMLEIEMQILDPADPSDEKQVFATQYYSVGSLPVKRLTELGWQIDMKKRKGGAGGYLPSADNETGAVEGPFIVLESKQDIWDQADYAMFMGALLNLGLNEHLDRLEAQGVSCLDGTIVHMASQVKPKGKNAKADAKERNLLIPDEVRSWGWETPVETPAAAAAPKPAAKPKPAPVAAKPAAAAAPAAKPAAVPAPPAPKPAAAAPAGPEIATFASATEEQRDETVTAMADVITKAGSITKKAFAGKLFLSMAAKGPARTTFVQIANDPDTVEYGVGMGLFAFDAATETFSAVS